MKAIQLDRFGDADVLTERDVPDSAPGPGEVLVAIAAAAVNHLDLDIRAGVSGFSISLPHTLGREGAGVVSDVGPGVTDFKIGDRVIVSAYPGCYRCDQCRRGLVNLCETLRRPGIDRPGTYSTSMKVATGGLFRLPDDVSFDEGACLQLSFGTAWHALVRRAGLRAGETVLITAAGSGVGSAAIQVAALAGARVIASAGSPTKLEAASRWGAEVVVNYRTQDLVRAVLDATSRKGVDVVLDGVGGEMFVQGTRCLRSGGRLVTYGAHGGEHVDFDLIGFFRSYGMLVASRGWTIDDMEMVIRLAAKRKLIVPLFKAYPLNEASRAHRLLEAGEQFGKVVLHPETKLPS